MDRGKETTTEQVDQQRETDLDQFREKWRAEVSSRSHPGDGAENHPEDPGPSEEKTALDYYRQAVERELVGKHGESIELYRRAFRMDSQVDKVYQNKYFPHHRKPSQPNPTNLSIHATNTAHHSLDGPSLSLPDLITSFAGVSLQPAPPEIEGTPAPPCPIADIPTEILLHIFGNLAVLDVGDFFSLSQVCKRFAYLFASDDHIWRRVCLESPFGFSGMSHYWQRDIMWGKLDPTLEFSIVDGEMPLTLEELQARRAAENEARTSALLHSQYTSSWLRMFRQRPRIRFNGCYISTVNYTRQGQAQVSTSTWSKVMHTVTYYRYLRFFSDGTLISLLTTAEPAEVVPYLTKELLRTHSGNANQHLVSAAMTNALRGRWRLSSSSPSSLIGLSQMEKTGKEDHDEQEQDSAEGKIYIETEGAAGPKYLYAMELTMRGSGQIAARHRKLLWNDFWSYNRLTGDWGQFELKNDKPYYFSRVKSYGLAGV